MESSERCGKAFIYNNVAYRCEGLEDHKGECSTWYPDKQTLRFWR